MIAALTSWAPAPFLARGGELDWIGQAIAIFVVFVLPVLRGLQERRKKQAETAARRAASPRADSASPAPPSRGQAGERATGEMSGKDVWKMLLEGKLPPQVEEQRRRAAAARESARGAATKQQAPPQSAASRAPQAPAGTAAASARTPAELRPQTRFDPGPAPAQALGRQLGSPFEGGVLSAAGPGADTPLASPLAVGSRAAERGPDARLGADPATLDDEVDLRWGIASGALEAREADGATAWRGVDWRRAIALAEVLGPPLAVRASVGDPLGPWAARG